MFIHGGFPTNKFCNVIWFRGTLALDRGVVGMWCTIQCIFYVMCYECGDSDGYRCQHRSA
jgi:hypothetical protein